MNDRNWSIKNPILVIAPHLYLPTQNGADILVERIAGQLSIHSISVDMIGCDFRREYKRGQIIQEKRITNNIRSKHLSAALTLMRRSHYLKECFNTPSFCEYLNCSVDWGQYGTILASYITTVDLIPALSDQQRLLIWTHNDEMKWFKDLIQNQRNPLAKKTASYSHNWLVNNFPRVAKRGKLLHLSSVDETGYSRIEPAHDSIVVQAGTDLDEDPQWPEEAKYSPVILSFIGSLSPQMASDALKYFKTNLYPNLLNEFRENLLVRVIGSHPRRAIRQMAKQSKWELHANVSDQQLGKLLRESTFTILPFPYATGVKLKLIRSLGSGVPYLSTLAAGRSDMSIPPGCCCSDNVVDWINAIIKWQKVTDKVSLRKYLFSQAQKYSWGAVTERLVASLESNTDNSNQ